MNEYNEEASSGASKTAAGILVFDVETIPVHLDATALRAVGELAQKQAERWQKEVTVANYCSLSPPLAAVCSVSMHKFGTPGKAVYYLAEPFAGSTAPGFPDTIVRGYDNEKALLEAFFIQCGISRRFVTFNGRSFDFPLMLSRALAHRVSPPPSFLRAAFEYRYRPDAHIDLLELFTLFGAGSRYPLNAYCIGQGIDSSKEHGSGGDVLEWVKSKDLDSLVRYSLADVEATLALYENWTNTVNYSFERT